MEELTLLVTYRTAAGRARDFVHAVEESGVLDTVRGEQGCRAYGYFLPADRSDEVLLVERWESRASQLRHLEQPHMGVLAKIKDAYVVETRVEALAPAADA